MLSRAHRICSNWTLIHAEIVKLKEIMGKNHVADFSRGAGTYEDKRTSPDQVLGKLVKRHYLIDINHFLSFPSIF